MGVWQGQRELGPFIVGKCTRPVVCAGPVISEPSGRERCLLCGAIQEQEGTHDPKPES